MNKLTRHLCLLFFTICIQQMPSAALAEEMSRPITAWPLIHHRGDHDRAETDVIWPLFKYERVKTWTRYALRPFIFSTENDPEKNYRKTSVVWPLSIYRREGPKRSFHIFPLYWYKDAPDSRHNVIVPLYWDIEGTGYSYFHLWPFFGINRRGEHFTEYSVIFPFFRYGRDRVSGEQDIHAPWPIVNYHTRENYVSHRFLPLYWYERGASRSGGFVFPYYWRTTPTQTSRGVFPLWYSSGGEDVSTNLVFPLYYNREAAGRRLRFITPLYFSNKTQTGSLSALIPLYLDYVSPERRLRFITPLYASSQTEKSRLKTLIPLYLDYEKQDFGLTIGLPVYLRYRSGAYTFSSFFPIYYSSKDEDRGTAFTYYFPLYGHYRRGDSVSRHLIFFPLFSQFSDDKQQLKSWDLLWPLFHYEASPASRSVRALPLYWHTRSPKRDTTVVFPLYWSFTSGENSYRHLLPFYGVHREGDWYTQRFVFGPVYMSTRDIRTGLSRQDFLFPFFSTRVEGDKKRSWLIPFYFHKSERESRLTLGSLAFLPPYYVHSVQPGRERLHVWPFYGKSHLGSYREHSVLWPLIRFGSDTEKDTSVAHFLLYYRARDGKNTTSLFFPLWGRRTTPETTYDASLFLHWYDHDKTKDSTQLSLLWLIPPKISLIRYQSEPGVLKHGFFPLYSYSSNETADSLEWSLLWPLFSYSSRGEVARQTGFLWKVISYERMDQESYDFRFLWRFIRKSKTAASSTFEFNPLYYYEAEEGKGSYWAILGGLFGVETAADGEKNFRFLWIF